MALSKDHRSNSNHFTNYTEDDHLRECMYVLRDYLDRSEAEFHKVAAKYNPDYVKAQWTFEQRVSIISTAGIDVAIMAARNWNKWQKQRGEKTDSKPFSTDVMIEGLFEFTTWACGLWFSVCGGQLQWTVKDSTAYINGPSVENDYWSAVFTKSDGQ